MPEETRLSRRGLLRVGLGVAAGTLGVRLVPAQLPSPECAQATPEQIQGPFYPTKDQEDEDVDLTRVRGRSGRSAGQVIVIRGKVVDELCKPIQGALIEIWQANAAGRYDHERDASNPRPLDPNFQGWAEMRSDEGGGYQFKTIKPGSYPADDTGWIRPPHIHFKVARRGYHELITQLYFAGESLNEPDHLRAALSRAEQARVTVECRPDPTGLDPGALTGVFEITLRRAV